MSLIPASPDVLEHQLFQLAEPIADKLVLTRREMGAKILHMVTPMAPQFESMGATCEMLAYVCDGCTAEHCELRVSDGEGEWTHRYEYDGERFSRKELPEC